MLYEFTNLPINDVQQLIENKSDLLISKVINEVINGFDISYKEFDELHFYPHYCKMNFKSEEDAWKHAEKFAELNRGKYVDIYVIGADKKPVAGYEEKRISNLKYIVLWKFEFYKKEGGIISLFCIFILNIFKLVYIIFRKWILGFSILNIVKKYKNM